MTRWTTAAATTWYRKTGAIRGCNYLPRTAVNSTEMWQAATFDPQTIDQELGWAAQAGYNGVRVFLQYLVWQDDAEGLKARLRQFLTLADRHGLGTMLILFCDCSFGGTEPYLGRQAAPVPGVHNSGWVPSPGRQRVTDKSCWPDLERYVKDIVGGFAADLRVRVWDLYNEPGNSNLEEQSLPLVEAAFAWARATNPVQPLTSGAWHDFDQPLSQRLAELSDVVSFHGYASPEAMADLIAALQTHGRPILCTEWLCRQGGNTFENILPLFARHRIGWYHWGLVAGRTQTYLPWGAKAGEPPPAVWQHDTFRADGAPYDPQEMALLRAFAFAP